MMVRVEFVLCLNGDLMLQLVEYRKRCHWGILGYNGYILNYIQFVLSS